MAAKNSEMTGLRGGHSWTHGLRVFALWAAVIIGCLSLGSYVVVRWVERQILTTENWVALVSPLPKQPVVSTALGNYIGAQVFQNVPVEQKIRDALPPRADFLAGPLAVQLQGLATKAAQDLVASDAFQTIWSGANRVAMNRLVAQSRGETPPLQQKVNERFNINLSDSRGKLRDALGKAADVFPALEPASQKAIDVSANLQARPRRIHQVIQKFDTLNKVLPFLTLAALLSALALAWRRRVTIMVSAVTVFILMLVELIALKWLRQETLSQVRNEDNLPAASYIYDTLLSGLKARIYVVLVAMVVVWALCLLAGPSRWAVSFRSSIALDRLQRSRLGAWWRTSRAWVRQYLYYLWVAALVVVLGIMALLSNVSGQVVLNAGLVIVSLCALLYIIATPHTAGLKAAPS
jgi:hypothetical protein